MSGNNQSLSHVDDFAAGIALAAFPDVTPLATKPNMSSVVATTGVAQSMGNLELRNKQTSFEVQYTTKAGELVRGSSATAQNERLTLEHTNSSAEICNTTELESNLPESEHFAHLRAQQLSSAMQDKKSIVTNATISLASSHTSIPGLELHGLTVALPTITAASNSRFHHNTKELNTVFKGHEFKGHYAGTHNLNVAELTPQALDFVRQNAHKLNSDARLDATIVQVDDEKFLSVPVDSPLASAMQFALGTKNTARLSEDKSAYLLTVKQYDATCERYKASINKRIPIGVINLNAFASIFKFARPNAVPKELYNEPVTISASITLEHAPLDARSIVAKK